MRERVLRSMLAEMTTVQFRLANEYDTDLDLLTAMQRSITGALQLLSDLEAARQDPPLTAHAAD